MPNETVVLDAAGSNIDGTDPGSPLIIGPGTPYGLNAWDYPAAPQSVLYASSVDTEGELPASARDGNRTITLKFKFVDATGSLLTALQAKFGKLRREGGTLKRTMKNGDVRIYDIIAGDGWMPVYDFDYYVANVTVVEIVLPARPYSRGVEVDLGDNVETTLPVLIFTDTGITGDAPGLGRLVVDNDAATAQRSLLWGIQSRYYSSASTAALFYQAESCQMISASTAVGPAGASGAGSNVAQHTSLTLVAPIQLFYLGAASTQTHIGAFRVIARVQAPVTNSGIVSLAVGWRPSVGASTITNDPVSLSNDLGAALEGAWHLMDLGQVNLPKAVVGSQGWSGWVEATCTFNGDDIAVDWIGLIPINEGTGHVGMVTEPAMEASGSVQIRHDGIFVLDTGTSWRGPDKYEGDYLLIPPAGPEARTLRVWLKGTEQQRLLNNSTPPTGVTLGDNNIEDISARLFVTPRYLT